MSDPVDRVLVDLSPLLSGGANGGAKPFVIALVAALAHQHPETLFEVSCRPEILIELASALKSPNILWQSPGPTRRAPFKAGFPRFRRWLVHKMRSRRRLRPFTQPPVGVAFCPFGPALIDVRGLPVVAILYDLQFRHYPQFFCSAEVQLRQRHFDQILKESQAIATISQFSCDTAVAAGANPDAIQAIPIQLQAAAPTHQARPASTTAVGPRFVYPANLWLHKNHELLFTAWAMAMAQGLPTDARLLLTGDAEPSRRNQLEQLASRLGVAKSIAFSGFVPRNTLDTMLASATAMVFPSLYEGFGIPVIEAMSRGIPVACSQTTALHEVAGDAALGFNPAIPQSIASALLRLTREPELRAELIRRGRQRAESFLNHDSMVEAYWQLLCRTARRVS